MKNDPIESRIAVLVDCDNVSPDILGYALEIAAQFGRIVLRLGYGNQDTLGNKKWKDALVRQAFTPCLQYQYAAGKNTSDIALVLDAQETLFDERADAFCLVTSDSDFTYLCRKLRGRGAMVYIVGEEKTPTALRNAGDQFCEWKPESQPEPPPREEPKASVAPEAVKQQPSPVKGRPLFVVKAVSQLIAETSEGKINLSALGQYLKRTQPDFSPKKYGHSSLLNMVKTYDLLVVASNNGGHEIQLADKTKPQTN